MSKGQRHLNLQNVWKKASYREIKPHELAKIITKRLEKLKVFNNPVVDEEKEEILSELKDFMEYVDGTFDDLDYILDRIYAWGDTSLDGNFGGKKVCWIKTRG